MGGNKFLTENTTYKTVTKGTVLQRPGDKTIKIFCVLKGLLRSYLIDEKGKEHIFLFAPEGWIIRDAELLTKHDTAGLYIDALEDSEIEVINENVASQVEKLSATLLAEEINALTKKVNMLQVRLLTLMSSTAEKRYNHFLENHPEIAQRVPQKMIASYIGVTPEALSTIRSKMRK